MNLYIDYFCLNDHESTYPFHFMTILSLKKKLEYLTENDPLVVECKVVKDEVQLETTWQIRDKLEFAHSA